MLYVSLINIKDDRVFRPIKAISQNKKAFVYITSNLGPPPAMIIAHYWQTFLVLRQRLIKDETRINNTDTTGTCVQIYTIL